ncbi:MAG TPA: phosphate acyltransferase, partial [Phycisphaerae bacterium]|nr:phosphate acyltransferase [Phycisphaerae bacterium]
MEKIVARARRAGKRIVLPESEDARVLQAAREITDGDYARVILLGNPDEIRAAAKDRNVAMDGIEVVDPRSDADRGRYVDRLHGRRKDRGMTRRSAEELLGGPVYYGGMMVADGRADGMVAGSVCPTR